MPALQHENNYLIKKLSLKDAENCIKWVCATGLLMQASVGRYRQVKRKSYFLKVNQFNSGIVNKKTEKRRLCKMIVVNTFTVWRKRCVANVWTCNVKRHSLM